MTEKACKRCGIVQPLEEFYKRGDWVYTKCRTCHKLENEVNRHNRRLKNPPKPREKVDHGPCAFEGCHNKGKSRLTQRGGPEGWFCTPHWTQWRKKGTMKPLLPNSRSYVNDKVRRCTACNTIKAQAEFHGRKGGGSQSQCKRCQYLTVRTNVLIRERRFQEALTMAQSMPEAIRKKYVDKVSNAIRQAEFERSNGGTNE